MIFLDVNSLNFQSTKNINGDFKIVENLARGEKYIWLQYSKRKGHSN